jgi:DNA-binding transcriptional regulator YhcF (GntR family)
MTKRNINYPVGFDGKELQGYFMISNQDAAAAILNKLTGTQLRLWLYLMMVDSFADRASDGEKVYHTIPSPLEIATKIGANPETVEKDMRKLKKLGLYEYRITAWQGHNLSAAKAREESERLKNKKETSAATAKTKTPHALGLNNPQERLNNPPHGLNNPQERLNNPPHGLNNPPTIDESIEKSEVSESPQTIQTYSDFKDSLSEGERENFLSFVKEKTKNLSQPINDIEAWLASTNKAGQNRWFVYHNNFLASLKSFGLDPQKPPIENKSQQAVKRYEEELEQRKKAAQFAWEKRQKEEPINPNPVAIKTKPQGEVISRGRIPSRCSDLNTSRPSQQILEVKND